MSSATNGELSADLLERLPAGALVVDSGGVIRAANSAAARMLNIGREALVQRRLADLGPAAAMGGWMSRFGQRRSEALLMHGADGAPLSLLATAAPADPLDATGPELVLLMDAAPFKAVEEDLRGQYKIIAELSNRVFSQAERLTDQTHRLEDLVAERTADLHEANMEAIYMLAVACEARDDGTGSHVRRIQHYAEALAEKLGLPRRDAQAIGYSAILHDVGKIHLADAILKKPGSLTDVERRAIQEHTLVGERILSRKPFFALARRIARSHHENWDGSGYPDRMSGGAIPLEARIVHLVDVYDALTSERVYKEAWVAEEAVQAIEDASGRMFEPEMVKAFVALRDEGEMDRIRKRLESEPLIQLAAPASGRD